MSSHKGLLTLALLLATSCESNEWGARCESNDDCGSGLLCVKQGPADDPNLTGLCRYSADEVRCGALTVLRDGQCVPDPDLPPELTCGPGTVDDDGQCVLVEDAGAGEPDAGDADAGTPDAGAADSGI